MTGALLQLVAAGASGSLLASPAGPSFFRQVYQRHTNFAMESIPQVLRGRVEYGGRVTCAVDRGGDLLNGLVLEIVMTRGSGPSFYAAEHLVKEVELEIGGTRVDAISNTWLRLYDELHRPVDEREAYRQMVDFGGEPEGFAKRFFVPLPFWFSRKVSALALPLIALQYHEVKLTITFEEAAKIPGVRGGLECRLWGSYCFLDTEERRWFARSAHEYLIEQTFVSRHNIAVAGAPQTTNLDLDFNHNVKYLAWVLKRDDGSHGLFTSNGQVTGLESNELYGPLAEAGLQFNGTDRFAPRKGSYFRLSHAWDHFHQAPSVGVYVYSFALHPKDWQPSASLNFSSVDSARLSLTTKAAVLASESAAASEDQTMLAARLFKVVEVYARSYNLLRVEGGMAGLVFAT